MPCARIGVALFNSRNQSGGSSGFEGRLRRPRPNHSWCHNPGMFSAAVEIVLTIAYREAVSRRHAYLTLEHLLYALAHDAEGERILQGCGAHLPRLRKELNQYLEESVEQLKRGHEREPEQTAAFQRVLQTAVLHVQSAQRAEVHAGDILAAIMQQPKSHASRLLQSHGISRL